MRIHHLLILFCLALSAKAQAPLNMLMGHHPFGPPIWSSAADSVAYMEFRSGMQLVDQSLDTMTAAYRMVWREDQHGGLWTVSRGDGSIMQRAGSNPFGLFTGHSFRMRDGRRGVVIIHDTPCGLICRNTFYYVDER